MGFILYTGKSTDIWKENVIENLERELLNYKVVRELLADLKKEFGGRDNKIMRVAELKKVKQENKMMKEFVQEFRRTVRRSGYEKRLLIEEFKQDMNEVI